MIHHRATQWMLAHLRSIQLAFAEFIRMPFTNLLTVCVIGLAITLPLCLFIALENLEYLDSTWQITTPTISLYLKTSAQQADIDALIQSLRANNAIEKVSYVSADEGLANFEKDGSFADVMSLFHHNPIPPLLIVVPNAQNRTPNAIDALYKSLKDSPFVDVAQMDINWVTRLYDIVAIGQDVAKGLAILFGFGIILVIAHTLRSQLTHHQQDVKVMRLIGANNAFIRRPLLYRGLLYGFLGGATAWAAIEVLLSSLQPPISQLAKTYQTSFQLVSLSIPQGVALLVIGSALGLIGAWAITTQFLYKSEQAE